MSLPVPRSAPTLPSPRPPPPTSPYRQHLTSTPVLFLHLSLDPPLRLTHTIPARCYGKRKKDGWARHGVLLQRRIAREYGPQHSGKRERERMR
jgi:hypothetical protein